MNDKTKTIGAVAIVMWSLKCSAETAQSAAQGSSDLVFLSAWIIANVSYAGMRAQGNPSNLWRITSFILGLPGTLFSYFLIREASERAFGIDLPKHVRQPSQTQDFRNLDGVNLVLTAWICSGMFFLFCILSTLDFSHELQSLKPMLFEMNIELPWSSRFLIAMAPLVRVIVISAGAFVVIKEWFIKDKRRSLLVTLSVSVGILLMTNFTNHALLAPMTNLAIRLKP